MDANPTPSANADQSAELADAKTVRRVIAASSVGTLFEWYDFYLYARRGRFYIRETKRHRLAIERP